MGWRTRLPVASHAKSHGQRSTAAHGTRIWVVFVAVY